jgi:hypothetical protein
MIELLTNPIIICLNALLTGIFTKLADLFVEHGYKTSVSNKVMLGVLWGVFGSLVVIGSPLVGAFYLGILLSWILRYKLDYYNHGIGGVLILVTLFFVDLPKDMILLISLPICILFTIFGLLSREGQLKRKLSWFHKYNIYSFLYLLVLLLFSLDTTIIIFASIANVFGYHGINWYFKRFKSKLGVGTKRRT